MGYKLHTDIPVQMTKHSKQNSCEQRGISVRSVSRCKQMLHWSSTSSFSSFSSERSSSERDNSGGGDSGFTRLAGGEESCMRSHTTVAGWVMGLLDHFGITRTTAPARCSPPHIRGVRPLRVDTTVRSLGKRGVLVQARAATTRMFMFNRAVIPRSSNRYG